MRWLCTTRAWAISRPRSTHLNLYNHYSSAYWSPQAIYFHGVASLGELASSEMSAWYYSGYFFNRDGIELMWIYRGFVYHVQGSRFRSTCRWVHHRAWKNHNRSFVVGYWVVSWF